VTPDSFSGRAPAFEESLLARRVAAARAKARPLIDLTDHNPTTADLGYLDDPRALAALADPAGRTYAPDPRGLPSAREAVSAYYADRGIAVSPERIVLTSGTSEAYAHAFRLLCNPYEAFLVPRPSYPLFAPIAQAEGCAVAHYPLVASQDGWRLPVEELEQAIVRTSTPRAVVVVNPNHPTGTFLTHEEAQAVRAACVRAGVALVSDEVFGDFHAEYGRPKDKLARSWLSSNSGTGHDVPLSFVFSGLSKVCGLPQLKLGWIVLDGPPRQVEAALEGLVWFADLFLSVAQPVQHALPALLAGRARFQDAVRARTLRNREALAAAVARIAGASLLPADGGWSAVIALPDTRSDEEWALALLELDVVAHPGDLYDFGEPGRLVLSLLPRPAGFDEALRRLADVAR
jgi:aspartate/methionine/tyrosine aminotransferase